MLALGLSAANATWYGGVGQYALGCVVLVLGCSLGWAFGPRAGRTGTRSAAGTAGRVTIVAVPLGAVLLTVFYALFGPSGGAYPGYTVAEEAAGILGLALIGLIVLGLPLAGLTFVTASIWVFLVRSILARLRSPESTG